MRRVEAVDLLDLVRDDLDVKIKQSLPAAVSRKRDRWRKGTAQGELKNDFLGTARKCLGTSNEARLDMVLIWALFFFHSSPSSHFRFKGLGSRLIGKPGTRNEICRNLE